MRAIFEKCLATAEEGIDRIESFLGLQKLRCNIEALKSICLMHNPSVNSKTMAVRSDAKSSNDLKLLMTYI